MITAATLYLETVPSMQSLPFQLSPYCIMAGFQDPSAFADPEDSSLVAEAKKEVPEPTDYSYTERDVILYNLGIGANEQELRWTYEGDDNFAALPTFGVVPQFPASSGVPLDWLPNFNPVGAACASALTMRHQPHALIHFTYSFRQNYCMVNSTLLSKPRSLSKLTL